MKQKFLFLFAALLVSVTSKALSFEEAQERAWFLTDKMAYELNLTEEQYNQAYEINFDYFYNIRRSSDLFGAYWNFRITDLRYILLDWQYDAFLATDYFFRPLRWISDAWHFAAYSRYSRNYYYYSRPSIYVTYYGRRYSGYERPYSPYFNVRINVGNGMRGGSNGVRPNRPAYDHRPGYSGGRPDGNRPGVNRPSQGGNRPNVGDSNRPGQGGSRPNVGNGNRPGQGDSNTNRPSRPENPSNGTPISRPQQTPPATTRPNTNTSTSRPSNSNVQSRPTTTGGSSGASRTQTTGSDRRR